MMSFKRSENKSSTSTSSNSRNASLYETPMNSPLDSPLDSPIESPAESTLNSALTTGLNSALESVSMTNASSLDSPTMDTLNTKSSQVYSPVSMSSNSTLKYERRWKACDANAFASRLPQSISRVSANTDHEKHDLLSTYLAELDEQHMQMIGLEQQMNLISLECKMIRENIMTKTNLIHTTIANMFETHPKKDAQTQTCVQTYRTIADNYSYHNIDTNICVSSEPIHPKENDIQISKYSEAIKHKLRRLPALVKGYLTRRLMKTEKVQQTIKTIRDTTKLLVNFKNDIYLRKITTEDINLHKRLIIQLENACTCFYDIFINYSKAKQMSLISQLREHLLERRFRNSSALSTSSVNSFPNLNTSISNGLTLVTRRKLEKKHKSSVIKSNSVRVKSEYLKTSNSYKSTNAIKKTKIYL